MKKLSPEEEIETLLEKAKVDRYYYEVHRFDLSLEPYYFWVVDFLGKTLRYSIDKVGENMGASVASAFFGEMSARREHLEKRGMEILATINAVIRSIINLLYDLRELDRRLKIYEDAKSEEPEKKESGELALKRVWMDEVDIKKGRGSINSLTAEKGLEFITLRDAFMAAKSIKEVDQMDLNERVKRILKDRLEEFYHWKEESYKELSQRKKIELSYLKSQVEALRLYAIWAKPYLKAAQMLKFKEMKSTDPEFIHAFDQSFIEIKIRGKKARGLYDISTKMGLPVSRTPPKFISREEKKKRKAEITGPIIYSILEVNFKFRARPAYVGGRQTGGVYRQFGMLGIEFVGYVLTAEELEKLEKKEEEDSLKFIEALTEESLKSLREDIVKYLNEFEALQVKEKKEKKKEKKPVLDMIFKQESKGKKKEPSFLQKLLTERARAIYKVKTRSDLFTLYDIFKKAHMELSFPTEPQFKPPLETK